MEKMTSRVVIRAILSLPRQAVCFALLSVIFPIRQHTKIHRQQKFQLGFKKNPVGFQKKSGNAATYTPSKGALLARGEPPRNRLNSHAFSTLITAKNLEVSKKITIFALQTGRPAI